MTIGDKIKYCRNKRGISQAKLAELSGADLSAIKRYETNKTNPTPPQGKKLARALGIGALAFSDMYFESLQELETYGDLIRLLIIFRKNHIIQIDGIRDKSGCIQMQTAVFKLNPVISSLFYATGDTPVEETSFRLHDNKTLEGLLRWESVYYKYESLLDKYSGNDNENGKSILKAIQDDLDLIELELQYDDSSRQTLSQK